MLLALKAIARDTMGVRDSEGMGVEGVFCLAHFGPRFMSSVKKSERLKDQGFLG